MAPYWILAAYAAGIGLSACAGPPPALWPLLAAALLASGWLLLRHSRWGALPLAGALVLAGFLWAHQALDPPQRSDHVSRFVSPELVAVDGVVVQAEQQWNGSTRLDIETRSIGTGAAARQVAGLVRLTVRDGGTDAAPGDRVCWRGRLRRPLLFGTPGEFDYPRHLAARGIHVTSSLGTGAELARFAGEPAGGHVWERWRVAIAARIAGAVAGDTAGLVQTLTVGIGGGISPQCRKVLSDGGLAHLFSISGLHFALLAMLVYVAASRLYRRSERLLLLAPARRLLPPLLLVPLYGYLLLSGNAAPTRRSFGMLALGALLVNSHRRTPPLALLSAVALGMLVLSPLSLFEPSFQLSFAGVAGLMVWMPPWQCCLDKRPAWMRGPGLMVLTTAAASLATAPLALWHFHQVAPAGLLANLPAIPLIAWGAVPAALAGALLTPLAPAAADLCFAGAGKLVAFTVTITEWCLALPGLQAQTIHVTWHEWCGVLVAVGACLPALAGRQRLILLCAALVLTFLPAIESPRLRVVALSVGQGDATLVTIAGRHHYLIDGGGLTGSATDIGERLVAPALGRLGVHRLRGVILTHDHPDHSAGLSYVLEQFPVDTFWAALPPERLDSRLQEALRLRRIPARQLDEGWMSLTASDQVRLDLFVPPQEAEDHNDRSVVVHAATGNAGVLLPGDLAVAGFEALCAAGLPEPATLLKLPHHGSRGSRPDLFLDRLRPTMAFVSAGRDNPYRLPHPSSVAACDARGIPLYRTDYQGTLTFTSDGTAWRVHPFLRVDH